MGIWGGGADVRGSDRARPRLDGTYGSDGPRRVVVWFGDSLAAGTGVSEAEEALAVRASIGVGVPVELRVMAVGGARVLDVLERQLGGVRGLHMDLAVVFVGTNDAVHLTRRRLFRSRYESLLSQLAPRALVVTLGIPDLGASPRFPRLMRDSLGWRARALSAEISGASSVAGAVFLDVCALTGQQFRADPGRLFAADRYHPGAEGQALLAETVTPALRDLLR